MRFQVPQFIEVESKIFGPLTVKQFVYLAGGAGIIFLLYAFLPFFFAVLLGLPVGGLAVALAFYKISNQSFVKVLESFFKYSVFPKVYVWKKIEKEEKPEKDKLMEGIASSQVNIPKLTRNKLKDLAWSLDIKEKTGEWEQKKQNNQ